MPRFATSVREIYIDIYQSALSLVIHQNGAASEEDADDLLDRYKRKSGLIVNKA
ncbi:MAG: hypothetical protein K2W95_33340 [Candidatus Obscuribacterales bacterium]|nr:hypothetical protein [Candidatus Obscuribacterales bacterium]